VTKNKILVLDIETSPLRVTTWGLHDQYIGRESVVKDWTILAWSAKWLGEPASKLIYMDQRHEKSETDKNILGPLWALLDEADIVITHNGKAFDSKKINSRFMLSGMKPPSPYLHLDTFSIARSVGSFTSNSLEYLTAKFCKKYKKVGHKKFPGMSLWDECLKGNIKAWDEMKRYNIHDTLSTEELYLALRGWTPASMPHAHMVKDPSTACTVCGSKHLIRRGSSITRAGERQRFTCRDCGKWQQGAKTQ
jgi:DNA polymerase elongation subunit (family B)